MRIVLSIIICLFLQPTWAFSNHSYNRLLEDAFRIGKDTDGKSLYLCIAKIHNSMQPGKTWNGYGLCNVPYAGKEHVMNRFEIPSRERFNSTHWQTNALRAIAVGSDINGEPLFLCQAFFRGSKQPGKTWPGYNHCNIAYAGREIITDNYRVLSRHRHRRLHVDIRS